VPGRLCKARQRLIGREVGQRRRWSGRDRGETPVAAARLADRIPAHELETQPPFPLGALRPLVAQILRANGPDWTDAPCLGRLPEVLHQHSGQGNRPSSTGNPVLARMTRAWILDTEAIA
jgi:hypothetical protein